jgi:hypothetical protein
MKKYLLLTLLVHAPCIIPCNLPQKNILNFVKFIRSNTSLLQSGANIALINYQLNPSNINQELTTILDFSKIDCIKKPITSQQIANVSTALQKFLELNTEHSKQSWQYKAQNSRLKTAEELKKINMLLAKYVKITQALHNQLQNINNL